MDLCDGQIGVTGDTVLDSGTETGQDLHPTVVSLARYTHSQDPGLCY